MNKPAKTKLNMIINLMTEVKHIYQKLLLIRLKIFNSFIATDFIFGFSFGSVLVSDFGSVLVQIWFRFYISKI